MSGRRSNYDVVIVGGGVIGLTTALELRRRLGREGRIALLDRQQPGQEASWAGAGIIPPGDLTSPALNTLARRSHALWPDLSAELRERTGIDNGYHRCTSIEICESTAAAEHESALWRQAGVETEPAAEALPGTFVPQVTLNGGTAYRLPTTAQVRNPRQLRALQAAVGAHDDIIPHAAVTGFTMSGRRVTTVHTAEGDFHADRFLIAAGAWTPQVLKTLSPDLPAPEIEPVRGQIVLLRTASTTGWAIVEVGKRYLVPRQDGRVLVGSTEEHAGFQKENTPEALAALIRFAGETVPALQGAEVEKVWAGLRPHAKRGRPSIGPVPGIDNLFLAAGHYRAGLSLSPATARLAADQILGITPEFPAQVVNDFAI